MGTTLRPPGFKGLIQAGGTFVALSTVLGHAGRYHWTLDLFAHFRVQYFVLLAVAALLHAFMRSWRWTVFFGAFAAWNLCLLLPFYAGDRIDASAPNPCRIRVLSLNVHTESTAYDKVIALLREEKPDVAFLMEIDAKWLLRLQDLSDEFPKILADPRPDNFGVALLSREPWTDIRIEHLGDADVPSIAVDYVRCDKRFTIFGTHPVPPPTPETFRLRNQQLDAVADYLSRATNSVILAGDLNVTPWSYWFRRFVARTRLNDTAPGFGVRPTWFGPSFIFGIPIDHMLVSGDLRVVSRRISRDVGSDHRALIVDLDFQ